MIRLRHALQTGLRHPVYGPLLLLAVGLLLAFVVFHAVEHGVVGEAFACAILAAATLRLVGLARKVLAIVPALPSLSERAPPRPRTPSFLALSLPSALLCIPLRR